MKKILIIEDDSIIRNAYKTILATEGYDVEEAIDGQHGLEKVSGFNPDLIILDLLMPRMDGIEFLKKFDLAKHPETKVLIFSNSSVPDKVKQAMELGATKYLVKANMPPRELVKTVSEILG